MKNVKKTISILMIFMMVLSYGSSVSFMAGGSSAYAQTETGVTEEVSGETENAVTTEESDSEEAATQTEESGSEEAVAQTEESSSEEAAVQTEESSSGKASSKTGEDNSEEASAKAEEIGSEEETAETEESDSEEAEEELPAVDRSLTVIAKRGKAFEKDDSGEKTETKKFSGVQKFWNALTGRDATLIKNGEDEPLVLKISGRMPENVSAEATFYEFDETADYDAYKEAAFFALEIKLRDSDGNNYVPEEPLRVKITSDRLAASLKAGDELLVYSYEENEKREKAAKKAGDKLYGADVLVYRSEARLAEPDAGKAESDGEGENEEAASGSGYAAPLYELYDADKKYKNNEDAVRYFEDANGYGITDKYKIVFDYSYGITLDAEASDKDMYTSSARFVLSAKKYKTETDAEKTEDDDASEVSKDETKETKDAEKADKSDDSEQTKDESTESEDAEKQTAADEDAQDKDAETKSESDAESEADAESGTESDSESAPKSVTLAATDDKTYKISVSYGEDAGLPEGLELEVQPITNSDDSYEGYVEKAAEAVDAESVRSAHVFDITLVDPTTGDHYQPNENVKVSIELLKEDVSEDDRINVVHFKEGVLKKLGIGSGKAEVMDSTIDEGKVEFESDSFSVYVVVDHEGGVVTSPRVEFHFIDRYSDDQYTQGIDVTQSTTADPYNFVNTGGSYQTTQILNDGETLELINDPENISVSGIEKFFYGWYVVEASADTSEMDSSTGKYSGTITFQWPDSPDQIHFEETISITANDANGDGSITVPEDNDSTDGDTVTWTLDGVTGTAALDRSGTAHVYLAPIYEDFYFVNFHKGPRADSSLSTHLMTRKLVVFGSGKTAEVHIGNVICESPDPTRKFFAGWEEDHNNDGDYTYHKTVTHVEDSEGNLVNEEVDSDEKHDGYYITVSKNDSTVSYLDLYPVFDEARWIYFNRGASGNGSTYVGASYRVTNDTREEDDDSFYYYFDDAFFAGDSDSKGHMSRRTGYELEGWYLFANMDDSSTITNLTDAEDVAVTYLDSDNVSHETTINTTAIKLVDSDGNIVADVGTYYVSSTGVVSQDSTDGAKLFEVDSDGHLRFYKALDQMTLSARWEVVQDTTFKVIVWKESMTDTYAEHGTSDDTDDKNFDFVKSYTLKGTSNTTADAVSRSTSSSVTDAVGTYYDAVVQGTTSDDTAVDETLSYTGFYCGAFDEDVTISPEGTSVINIYYYRNVVTYKFYTYGSSQTGYTITTSNDTDPQQYGLVNGEYVELSYVEGDPTYTYTYNPTYTETSTGGDGLYGIVDGVYQALTATPIYKTVYNYYLYDVTTDTDGTQYGLVSVGDGEYEYQELTRIDNSAWTPKHTYTVTTDSEGTQYGVVDGKYVELDSTSYYKYNTWTYTGSGGQTKTHSGTLYKKSGGQGGKTYATSYTTNSVFEGEITETYYTEKGRALTPSDPTVTVKWTITGTDTEYTDTRYTQESYTGTALSDEDTIYTIDGICYYKDTNGYYVELDSTTTYTWQVNGEVYDGTRYVLTSEKESYTGTHYTRNNVLYGIDSNGGYVALIQEEEVDYYTYTVTATATAYSGKIYSRSDTDTDYTGTRYTRSESTPYTYTATSENASGLYGKDANGVYVPLSMTETDNYYWAVPEYGDVYTKDNTNGTYGYVDGNYVLLTVDTLDNYTETTSDDGTQYALVDGEYKELTSTVYTKYNWIYSNSYYGDSYTGKLYSYSYYSGYYDSGYTTDSEFTSTPDSYYGNYNGYAVEVETNGTASTRTVWYLDGEEYSGTRYSKTTVITGYSYNGESYTGDRYTKSYDETGYTAYTGTRWVKTSMGSGWNLYRDEIGLYGEKLNWPSDTSLWWYESHGNSSGSGTRMTYKDAFLPLDDDMTIEYWAASKSGSGSINFYTQSVDDPDEFVLAQSITSSSGNFSINDKFSGYHAYQYRTDGGSWKNVGTYNESTGIYGSSVSYDSSLDIRYICNTNDLIFFTNYPTGKNLEFNGVAEDDDSVEKSDDEVRVEDLRYGTSLSSYSNYYDIADNDPTGKTLIAPDHYIFGGWYKDDTCTEEFDFDSTMPDGNAVAYAKWTPETFVIHIDPAGGEIDHVNHNGYSAFGSGTVTVNGQSKTYDFTGIDSSYDQYPLDGRGNYNKSQSTYIRAEYSETVSEYEIPRRFVAMTDRVAEEYENAGGTVYYYMNYQWQSTDGASGIYSDVRSALYLTEEELSKYYALYQNIVIYSLGIAASANEGMTLLDYDTWKSIYVSSTKYRVVNSNENWTFLGWYKTPDGGEEEAVPYNFSDPVDGSFTLTAHWRLDGGYSIEYVPEYTMDDGSEINGEMPAWRDPPSGELSYSDGAETEIYKAPTGLTKDGEEITDDSVIFRGWALVSKSGTDENPIYTPLETDSNGNITTYYLPSDEYTVNAANAGTNNKIYFQAIYQYKDSSDRRPVITNLTIDANEGYLNSTDLPDWSYPGEYAVNTTDHLDADGNPTQILFGDIQSNAAVHLYKYATEITKAADGKEVTDSHQYFSHPNDYFLLGFDDAADEGDYSATYPADSVIAIDRNDNKTIYAVWEPMVYVTFVNNTGVTANDVSFGLSSSLDALQVINVVDGMYERTLLSDYGDITLADGESITLAVPKGAEETLTVSGTNTLGVGKKLVWNSSLDLVTDDGTVTYDTSTAGVSALSYDHTVGTETHTHTLVGGSVNNTKSFSFDETMIVNKNAVTVTFTSINNDYALLLYDNYDGGGTQEIDYGADDIKPEDGVAKTQVLPKTSTRIGYSFIGWAYDADATVPDFSATSPESNPWTILDLNNTDGGFFSTGTVENDGVITRTLYAVWEAKTDAIYIYKNVPEPGNQEQAFEFTVAINGEYHYGTVQNTKIKISTSKDIMLKHGEYMRISSSNYNAANVTSGSKQTAYVQAAVEVYSPTTNEDGSTSYTMDDDRSTIVRWEKENIDASGTNGFSEDLTISVTEGSVAYYDTSVVLSSESGDGVLTIGDSSTFSSDQLPQTVDTNTVSWNNTDAGGTMTFVNQRQTYDVQVTKTLTSKNNTPGVFNYNASYTETYTTYKNNKVESVPSTTGLPAFTVTSGSFTTLEDIPAGVSLTITEETDDDNNYDTYVSVDGADETEGKSCTSFTVGESPADSTNNLHVVAFRNVLKSYEVTFKLVDQNEETTVSGMFSLGSLGSNLYANCDSVDPPAGVFYTSDTFWADEYTLSQTIVAPDHIGLPQAVTITVTGNGITSSDTENIVIEETSTGVYLIKVINHKTVDINVESGLLDPMISQRTFVYSGYYWYKDNKYDLNRNIIGDDGTPSTFNLIAYSTEDGSVSDQQETKELAIPVGATGLTIYEDVSQKTTGTETIESTYDVSRKYNQDDRVAASQYVFQDPIVDSNANDTITFYNQKKTIDVTISKTVTTEDTQGEFSFTAELLNGTTLIKGYPIFINGTALDTSDDAYTDSSTGQYIFGVRHNDSYVLTIPIGAKLTVQETDVTDPPDGMTIDSYGTSVDTTVTSGGAAYTGDTSFNDEDRLYTLKAAPSTPLTVSFINGPSGGRKVILRKVLKSTYVPIEGRTFTVYRDDACTSVASDTSGNKMEDLESTASGVFFVGELSNGTYYVREDGESGYFTLVVDADKANMDFELELSD